MEVKKFLSGLDVEISKAEKKDLQSQANKVLAQLASAIKKHKIKAQAFIGGSMAKGTLAQSAEKDIDVFIRFDKSYANVVPYLDKIVKEAFKGQKAQITKLHGSRDYFQVRFGPGVLFELVPVIKISSPKDARNVTDLSYFHVGYVKKKIGKTKLAREIILMKLFCKSQGVYGAESYIQGFSGYGVECLILHFRSFEKLLKALADVKGQVVIDTEKRYTQPASLVMEMNESKRQGPIIFVDPTWKERNVLAALSQENFERFQKAAKAFLKHPSKKFFEGGKEKEVEETVAYAKKAHLEVIHLSLSTDRQSGDIAATKLRRAHQFLSQELAKMFIIERAVFWYTGEQTAHSYFVVKQKEFIPCKGPPVQFADHAAAFRKEHKHVEVREGWLYAQKPAPKSARAYLPLLLKAEDVKLRAMGATSIQIHHNN